MSSGKEVVEGSGSYSARRKFDSWRDFPQDDEHDLDDAENRYEKRFMQKENKKIKQQ